LELGALLPLHLTGGNQHHRICGADLFSDVALRRFWLYPQHNKVHHFRSRGCGLDLYGNYEAKGIFKTRQAH
jgi:hypothetical protein